jgi:hypothetical protein
MLFCGSSSADKNRSPGCSYVGGRGIRVRAAAMWGDVVYVSGLQLCGIRAAAMWYTGVVYGRGVREGVVYVSAVRLAQKLWNARKAARKAPSAVANGWLMELWFFSGERG